MFNVINKILHEVNQSALPSDFPPDLNIKSCSRDSIELPHIILPGNMIYILSIRKTASQN